MTDKQIVHTPTEEVSLIELIQKIKEWLYFLLSHWWKVMIIGFIGGVIGFFYAWMQPITYTAKTTFVVEDAKSGGGLSGLASLAGQFGVDVGGGGGGGLIAGDNILLYFKSESLAREVLLSPWDTIRKISLADKYIETHNLKKAWAKDEKIGMISFPADNNVRTRLQDSLLNVIINDYILKKQFTIAKIEKKAGFIELSISMLNEQLAKKYCDKIVEIAVKRYVDLKTTRQQKAVNKLQARADSIGNLLIKKTASSASLQTSSATMDVNPLYKTNSIVATELTTRDKTMLATVYAEVIKNLELAKFTLSQETPVIQIVDSSVLPLEREKKSRLKTAILFSFLFGFVFTLYLMISRYFKVLSKKGDNSNF